jgi:hypothetical protein
MHPMNGFPRLATGLRVILVVGPESTGTRAFTEILSAHPAVAGTHDARTHGDLLDPVWQALVEGDRVEAVTRMRLHAGRPIVVTRRSLPHGPRPGAAAEYRRFPPLQAFLDVTATCGRHPVVLITTRSPLANVVSWARERSSARNDLPAALRQYWAAYRLLFGICAKGTFPFHLLSLEALALEGSEYVTSLFTLLGLPPTDVPLDVVQRPDVNLRRYHDAWLEPPSAAADAA